MIFWRASNFARCMMLTFFQIVNVYRPTKAKMAEVIFCSFEKTKKTVPLPYNYPTVSDFITK